MTRDELKEVAKHVSKVGGFKETTIGFKAVESLLRMGEWSFHWFDKKFCLEMALWLQHIGLDAEIKSDAVKLSDEAIGKYYTNVMGLVLEPQYHNLSKGDIRLSVGNEESSGTRHWGNQIMAKNNKSE